MKDAEIMARATTLTIDISSGKGMDKAVLNHTLAINTMRNS